MSALSTADWYEEDDRTIARYGHEVEVVATTQHQVGGDGITTRTWHSASVDVDDCLDAEQLRELADRLYYIADHLDELNGVPPIGLEDLEDAA